MVHGRCQEQAILTIESLFVAAVAPRLDVARNQVLHALDLSNAAGMFDRTHVVSKDALAAARLDKRCLLGFPDRWVSDDGDLDAALPFLNVPLGCGRVALDLADLVTDIGHARRLLANQREECR